MEPFFSNLSKTIKKGYVKQHATRLYYQRLVKASLLISTVPMIAMCILIVYERLTFGEGMFAIIAVFYGSTFFAKPYVADLSSLTNYVEQLALDRRAETPPLSFLSNVEELSAAVKNLHASWGDRKIKLEAAIAESTILFDTLPDILLMLDDEHYVVRANNAAFIKFGRHIVGKPFLSFIQHEEVNDLVTEVLRNGRGSDMESSIEHQEGVSDYEVRIEKFPVHSPGGIAAVVVMHDVSELKRSKQMTKDFVANASHEIRTPLTSLIGFIETIRTTAKDDPEATQHFLKIMSEQAEHMRILVNDLLSLSKIEMHEDKRPTDPVIVNRIIKSAINGLQFSAENKEMNIIFKQAAKAPEVLGDANELTQVCNNLINNAIKYGAGNTDVEVTQDIGQFKGNAIREASEANQEYVTISVKNYGEGIAPEHIPRLTERFYRIDKARSRNLGGAGLGLAIVKHILNRHGAELSIQSVVNEWVTFTVYLPIPNHDEPVNNDDSDTQQQEPPHTNSLAFDNMQRPSAEFFDETNPQETLETSEFLATPDAPIDMDDDVTVQTDDFDDEFNDEFDDEFDEFDEFDELDDYSSLDDDEINDDKQT